jgi:HD-GYP domain-containing protein (c-di-GMP phosphodiesterase class II)
MAHFRITLCGVSPPAQGVWWAADQGFQIGSAEDVKVVLRDPSVRGRHAEVLPTEAGWVLYDLARTPETVVNGLVVPPTGRLLRLQDVIRCGNASLQVAALDAPGQPTIRTSGALLKVQGVLHRSWEQSLETWAQQEGPSPATGKHLRTLLRAGYHFCHGAPLDALMQSVLDDTVAELNAQRGCILLADGDGELKLRTVSLGGKGARAVKCYSRTLARRSFQRGESLLCRDVSLDEELQEGQSTRLFNMASIVCALLRSPRQRLGVLHLDRTPQRPPFTEADFFLADALAAAVSAAIESALLVEEQRALFQNTVAALARAVELRDRYTGTHTQRVTDYSVLLARELGLSAGEEQQIRVGTPLHDIGKIGISDAILQKPGRLSAAEFEQMKSHTVTGALMLASIPGMGPMIPIVRHHHERWDGAGYPDGLAGEAIPTLARIVAVADAFDAMTSDRPYRPALPPAAAFAEILAQAGSQFAPACARAFARLRPHIEPSRRQADGARPN